MITCCSVCLPSFINRREISEVLNVSIPRQYVNFPVYAVRMPLQLRTTLHYSQEQRDSAGLAVSPVAEDSFMYCDRFARQNASSKGCFFVGFPPDIQFFGDSIG